MKLSNMILIGAVVSALTGCQDQPRSSEYYGANLEQAQKEEQKCQQIRVSGKEPNAVLAKNCRIAHDVLLRRANANVAAAIKSS